MDISSLPEYQRTEGERYIEAIAEEEKEKKEFLQRKTELSERICSQEKELKEVQEQVSTLEAQVYIGHTIKVVS